MNGRAIAHTTLAQLGGSGKLQAMIGAHNFTSDEKGTLGFHFKGCRKANILQIELDPSDTYNVKFLKFNKRTLELKDVKEYTMVYADQLKEIVESFTGLYLSL